MIKKANIAQFVIILISTAFVIIQLCIAWDGGINGVFNSPDANANYYFSKRIYQNEPLAYALPFESSEEIKYLSTRSTRVIGNTIVPIGFLGLILLYGSISKLLFVNCIPYLTIIIAGFALYYFYQSLKKLFSSHLAIISAIVLFIHPAWWYYTNESLLPNILFISLCIFALYTAIRIIQSNRVQYYFYFGIYCGLAIVVRLSELIWILPIIFLGIIYYRKYINKKYACVSIVMILALLCVYYVVQHSIIPNKFPLGYDIFSDSSVDLMTIIYRLVVPFGFHPQLILKNSLNYIIYLFWPFSILATLGFVAMLRMKAHASFSRWLSYTYILLVVSIILIGYYGSWVIRDHPNPNLVTISISYVRYFLPIYLLSIPYIGLALLSISEFFKNQYRFQYTMPAIIALLALFSYQITMANDSDGIFIKRGILKSYDSIASWTRASLPESSIVISEKSDKYIWPHRMVMDFSILKNNALIVRFFTISMKIPTYYIGPTLKQDDLASINDLLNSIQAHITNEIFTRDGISVYPLTAIND